MYSFTTAAFGNDVKRHVFICECLCIPAGINLEETLWCSGGSYRGRRIKGRNNYNVDGTPGRSSYTIICTSERAFNDHVPANTENKTEKNNIVFILFCFWNYLPEVGSTQILFYLFRPIESRIL